jgi:hypothetical protein
VHVGVGGATFEPFLSVTSETASAAVLDLLPDTSYTIAVRSRGPKPAKWTALGPTVVCSTAPLGGAIALLRPPQGPAMATAVVVSFTESAPSSGLAKWTVYHRVAGSSAPAAATPVPAGSTQVTVSGLAHESTSYEVWVQTTLSSGADGPTSPTVLHRTTSRATSFFEAFRISELCGDACQPDLLGGAPSARTRALLPPSNADWH